MDLFKWPSIPWHPHIAYWEWIEAVPVVVGLFCAFLLFRRGPTRAIAVGLAGAFCVEIWRLVLRFADDVLHDAGAFKSGEIRYAWQVVYALVPVAWWVGCWIYVCYQTMRLFGDFTSEPYCPRCGTKLLPTAGECPKCHRGVVITARGIVVPAK